MKYFTMLKDFIYYNRKIVIVLILVVIIFLVTLNFKKSKVKVLDNETFFIEEKIKSEELAVKKVSVYIDGEIRRPGTYIVLEDSTVEDVIKEAGGLLESSDIKNLNMKEIITEGMTISIDKLTIKESKKEEKVVYQDTVININTSNIDSLMKLKGIGKVKAQAIIDYRNDNGNFKMIEEIMNVKGIGKATFEKIKDNIRV